MYVYVYVNVCARTDCGFQLPTYEAPPSLKPKHEELEEEEVNQLTHNSNRNRRRRSMRRGLGTSANGGGCGTRAAPSSSRPRSWQGGWVR